MSTRNNFEKPDENSKQTTIDNIKIFNRLDTLAVTECGNRCLSNFKLDKLSSAENVCLTSCYSKFYDSLEIGEKLFDLYSSKDFNITGIMKGKYEETLKNLKI
jgi:hypothetical protein